MVIYRKSWSRSNPTSALMVKANRLDDWIAASSVSRAVLFRCVLATDQVLHLNRPANETQIRRENNGIVFDVADNPLIGDSSHMSVTRSYKESAATLEVRMDPDNYPSASRLGRSL